MTRTAITRHKAGRGFAYYDATGSVIRDKALIQRIRSMGIPPAWQDVRIATSERARVQATGYDAAGRKQYVYNAVFRAKQEKAKFDRLVLFGQQLPHMRRVTGQHLRKRRMTRDKVLACMVRLIDEAYFRVGNERYAKENQTYGLTTLRSRHLSVEGDKLIFRYVGKSHKLNERQVENPVLAKVVSELDHLPGYEIFRYYDDNNQLINVKSDDLNAYIKDIMGHEFSAKDFRTWAGTLVAAIALDELDIEDPKHPTKKSVKQAIEHVAERLGNTPAIAKASYVDPRVIDHYLQGTTLRIFKTQIDAMAEHELNVDEQAVLMLLQRRLVRHTQVEKP